MRTHTIWVSPNDLGVHPQAKGMPEWPADDDRFNALIEDIRDRGIDQPIILDREHRIIDGRHRWRAAKRLQLESIPAVVRDDSEVASIIINSLIQRRHYSKSALAYLVYPVAKKAFEESKARRVANLKKGKAPDSALSARSEKTVEDLAEALGIGRRLFFQAKDVHQAFEKSDKARDKWLRENGEEADDEEAPADHRKQYEQKILDGEISLGAVLAGIGGQTATKGKEKPKSDQLELFEDAFETLKKRFTYWHKFDSRAKTEFYGVVQRTVSEMPPDLRKAFSRALAKAEKEAKEEQE